MKILVLGGTVFLGRHIVEAALQRGHEVTLFNRGKHNPDLFPNVKKLRGDRDGDLAALEGMRWDAVIDPSGYFPRIVKRTAELLAGQADSYAFISSISVYSDFSQIKLDESAPTGVIADDSIEEITAESYGPLKAQCERVVTEFFPDRSLIIRPGLIVGPHDPTDRFTYWPSRIDRGGAILAPGDPEASVQFIDVRDLASWIIKMLEQKQHGIYNATGPEQPLSIKSLLEKIRLSLSKNDADFHWVSDAFLKSAGVGEWMEMPLWIAQSEDTAGFAKVNCQKAYQAGLTFRPLHETVLDTLNWSKQRRSDYKWKAGLNHALEKDLLEKWHKKNTTQV